MRQTGLMVSSKSVFAPASTIAISTNCTGGVRPVVSESSTQNSPDFRRPLGYVTELARSTLRLEIASPHIYPRIVRRGRGYR